ncbi:MAG: hypothetical protein ACLS9K_14905 [Lachnospira eligens]
MKFIRYISVFNAELALLFTARYSVQGMGYGNILFSQDLQRWLEGRLLLCF